ncbi:MAG: GGDEF domain-containing protein [Archangium sp.]|nr:GGDEF domain-containing protein [Archangium sp.]
MDPVTAFLFATVLMMLNGAVLGVMHRDLAPALRSPAFGWRVGTLLIAIGCLVLALQKWLPSWLALTIGNGLLLAGLVAYRNAIDLFDGHQASRLRWLGPVVLAAGIGWFTAVRDDFAIRVVLASIAWVTTLAGSARALWRGRQAEGASSRLVLMVLFVGLALVMVFRAGWFGLRAGPETTVVDPGSWVNVLTPMLASTLPIIGTTAFLLMCSERLRRDWEHAASTDALTGLWNRRTLISRGAAALDEAHQHGRGLAVAVIDVDHFKSVNDRFGHEVGDVALQHVAKALRSQCRAVDLAARHGGEEFVVLLKDLDAASAADAAERLRAALAATPLVHGDLRLELTASFGVTTLTRDDRSFDDLLRRADAALYRAKHEGRNRVVVG